MATPDGAAVPAPGPGPDRGRLLADVVAGLSAAEKALPCKYFYDAAGSELFERICELPEYYVTRTELQLMQEHVGAMAAALGPRVRLVEFGSGAGIKTRLLLEAMAMPAGYVAVDISPTMLDLTVATLRARHPGLSVLPVCADYTEPFALPAAPVGTRRTVCYFPGSTIGNLTEGEAVRFLHRVRELVGDDGGLLLGFDLRKDPAVLVPAYNDAAGVTAAFNRNLLVRCNHELGADFVPDRFEHRAIWNGCDGRIEMQLIATSPQQVRIGAHRFRFRTGEVLSTEYSHKYTVAGFARLAARAGFQVATTWTDARQWFAVQLLVPPAP